MASPPTGTVTFLFTDIEGSTKLWEQNTQAMQIALARHDEVLRSAIEERGGYIFKTVGDAFCAAFATAMDAVGAALAAQRALHAESWEEGSPIRARMALHTGPSKSGAEATSVLRSTGSPVCSPPETAGRPCSRLRPRSW